VLTADSTPSATYQISNSTFSTNLDKAKFKINIAKLLEVIIKYPGDVFKALRQLRYSPTKFFKELKAMRLRMSPLQIESLEKLQKLMKQAKDSGQTALYETFEKEQERIQKEIYLKTNGFELFLTEEDLIEFKDVISKSIKLDWIENFCRIIPEPVLQELQRAKNLKTFDNFVILHYDPKGKSTKLTKKEIEKKKDPILFGVMKCSRRLYFIADWIDKYCDLSLDTVLDKIYADVEDRKLNGATYEQVGEPIKEKNVKQKKSK